mmetsp:Transcript_41117/g.50049  ORF Transcript_41117/g.50049 Transcript_41117/m.50049 type:complete len:94 (+) Transcript_41117:267-548(+)
MSPAENISKRLIWEIIPSFFLVLGLKEKGYLTQVCRLWSCAAFLELSWQGLASVQKIAKKGNAQTMKQIKKIRYVHGYYMIAGNIIFKHKDSK